MITPRQITEAIQRLESIKDPHDRWRSEQCMPGSARAVYAAMRCTAGDFKYYLDKVKPEHLELLIESAASSKVKTKLLMSRLRRRDADKGKI